MLYDYLKSISKIYINSLFLKKKKLIFILKTSWKRLDGLVVELALEFLVFGHLSRGLHKVLVYNIVPLGSNRKHTSLCAYVSQIGAIKPIG